MHGINQVADSRSKLVQRYLPSINLLLNADSDFYQVIVAERRMLDEVVGSHVTELKTAHTESLQQA